MGIAIMILFGSLLSADSAQGPTDLQKYMESPDYRTRWYAAREYYHLGKETRRLNREETVALVAHLKSDPECGVKILVTLALPYAEDKDWVVRPLIDALRDRDEASSGGGNVPAYAAAALAAIGDARALQPMREWLDYLKSNPRVYPHSRDLLMRIANRDISVLEKKLSEHERAAGNTAAAVAEATSCSDRLSVAKEGGRCRPRLSRCCAWRRARGRCVWSSE